MISRSVRNIVRLVDYDVICLRNSMLWFSYIKHCVPLYTTSIILNFKRTRRLLLILDNYTFVINKINVCI